MNYTDEHTDAVLLLAAIITVSLVLWYLVLPAQYDTGYEHGYSTGFTDSHLNQTIMARSAYEAFNASLYQHREGNTDAALQLVESGNSLLWATMKDYNGTATQQQVRNLYKKVLIECQAKNWGSQCSTVLDAVNNVLYEVSDLNTRTVSGTNA